MGDFDSGAAPGVAGGGRAPAHVIEKALAGRQLRDVLLFLDSIYCGIGPQTLAGVTIEILESCTRHAPAQFAGAIWQRTV